MAAWSWAKFSLKANRSGAEGTTVWTKLDKTLTGIGGTSNSFAPPQIASKANTLSANVVPLARVSEVVAAAAAGVDSQAEAPAFELGRSGREPVGEQLAS